MTNTSRSTVIAAAVVFACLQAAAARAALPNKCASLKETCASKKAYALLGCHSKAERRGTAPDSLCLSKAMAKFDGGTFPDRGCFEKIEARYTCFTTDDTASMETKVDSFVLDVVEELDPDYPTPVLNRCSSAKKTCVAKKVQGLLKCYSKAVLKGLAVDPACVSKVKTKFDGGAIPEKGCFAKYEAKYGVSCLTTSDVAALEAKVDAFADDVASELEPLCGNNTIESPFETCDGTEDTACPGLCAPPGAAFECTCPFCGDHQVNQGTEVCDRTDDSVCPFHCALDCTCAVCGNNITEFGPEECDGTDDVDCPGACGAPAASNECQCATCGDDIVNQGTEQCDGIDDSSCVGGCNFDCTCAVCGNNVAEPGETCDGTDDAACPALCNPDCTCP